ncbi:hypothetical protein GQ53DRAFT_81628 [Thozetella sp. PMI_491]|nr:hypothetical protein GQ53DRAFT_81628 [Thozetella sp. PMI_491]
MSSADDGSTTVTAKDDPLSRRIPVAESIETSAIQLANVEGDDLQPIPAFRLDELMTPAGGQGRPLRSTPEPGDLHEHATEATTVLNVDEPGSIIVSVEEQQPSLAIRSPEEQCPQEPATISFHIDKPKDSAAPVQERQPSLDIIRSTPVPQTGSTEEQSPQTEEISRMIDREFADAKTIVKEVMGVITQMTGTDALHTIESPDNPSNWSVGMWSTFLNASEGRSQRAKISNLLGYIGLSRWFEEKLAEYQPPRTRGGRARIRKATPFLDELLSSEREDSLTLQGGSPKGHASKTRKTITDARAKGGKLRRMISETGIGILLHPNIWAFMKDQASWRRYIAAMDRLGIRVLLPALDDQVDVLIAQGRTDPTKFLQSITLHPALTPDDISEIQVEFDLGPRILAGSMQSDLLDRLIILAKQLFVDSNAMKSTRMKADKKASAALSKRSVLSVSNRDIELASFDNLAPGKWLDAWLILAAMELTDTPSWVQYEPSIVLNSSDRSPFSNWKKRVDKYQRAGKARGVYFAPLHLNNNHYTLLEINTQLGKIFHYDSDAGTGILEGTDQNMLVKETVQAAFSHLHLEYEEAPCPQQDDTSSCGLMVIRNFVKRVGGQAAGTWRDRVRPEAERQELICLFIDAIKVAQS